MTQQVADKDRQITLQWSGDLTVRRIAELKSEVQKSLRDAEHVSIQIAPDAVCDMTLLQLLCAAHRTATRQEKTMEIAEPFAEQFKMVLDLAGFSRHVGCCLDVCENCLWMFIYKQLDGQALPAQVAIERN